MQNNFIHLINDRNHLIEIESCNFSNIEVNALVFNGLSNNDTIHINNNIFNNIGLSTIIIDYYSQGFNQNQQSIINIISNQ